MEKRRIEYLDAMRGFCMILVVYGHLALTANIPNLFGAKIFGTFYLPLFFFLSGFLSYSSITPPNP